MTKDLVAWVSEQIKDAEIDDVDLLILAALDGDDLGAFLKPQTRVWKVLDSLPYQ